MKLIPVWYVELWHRDYTEVAAVFLSEDEAHAHSDQLRGDRYVRSGHLATADGRTGFLVEDTNTYRIGPQ